MKNHFKSNVRKLNTAESKFSLIDVFLHSLFIPTRVVKRVVEPTLNMYYVIRGFVESTRFKNVVIFFPLFEFQPTNGNKIIHFISYILKLRHS